MQPLIALLDKEFRRAADELSGALEDVAEVMPATAAGERLRAYVLSNAVADSYEGLETLFRRIAADVDGFVPRGEDWHSVLLQQMTASGTERPSVIAEDTFQALNILRGFRHVVRHRYRSDLELAPVMLNVERMQTALPLLRRDLDAFYDFLREGWLRR